MICLGEWVKSDDDDRSNAPDGRSQLVIFRGALKPMPFSGPFGWRITMIFMPPCRVNVFSFEIKRSGRLQVLLDEKMTLANVFVLTPAKSEFFLKVEHLGVIDLNVIKVKKEVCPQAE